MVNGIRLTWEEETNYMLQQEKEKVRALESEKVKIDADLAKRKEYISALERIIELNKQQRGIKRNGLGTFDPEKFLKQSVKNSLLDIAAKNDGLLIVNEAVTILIEAKVFTDRDHARNSIYSNINHYKKYFGKERPGVYRLRGTRELPLLLNT
jgi:hypothetical protein